MSDLDAEQIKALAEEQLATLLSKLPHDPMSRVLLFMDATRILDYRSVFQGRFPKDMRVPLQSLEICRWGWGLAATHLLQPLKAGGVPFAKLDKESLRLAETMLYHFGLVMLMRRISEMMRAGYVALDNGTVPWTLRVVKGAFSHHADNIDFSRWQRLAETLDNATESTLRGWSLFQYERLQEVERKAGAFLGRNRLGALKKFEHKDLESLMIPLVHPWDTGKGVLMGYGARPELDDHFLAEAVRDSVHWRDEAGLDPAASFGSVNGADVCAVAAMVASLHLKHIAFGYVALKHRPEISIPHSLTIWEPRDQLIAALADWSPYPKDKINAALETITLHASEVAQLSPYSAFPSPLLVDFGNGFLLRPVASVLRNPLIGAMTMLEWRNPAARRRMIGSLETWMRNDLYGLFQGTRYLRIDGSIKIRNDSRIVTDVDAAVFDRTTGELALIQLKWQDYFTNDVRKLRSRARNLASELEEWAKAVSAWVQKETFIGVARSLRIRLKRNEAITTIKLFALSRTSARVHGYGFSINYPELAVGTWPQFQRLRWEIGPVPKVLEAIHARLQREVMEQPVAQPLPFEVNVVGNRIRLEDLWQGYESASEELGTPLS